MKDNNVFVDLNKDGTHYDVGIVGWWYNLNYGGTLTYYALHQLVKSMGLSVLMIERATSNKDYSPNYVSEIPRRFAKKYYDISRNFLYNELPELNNYCDAFISGSDQLFSPWLWEYSGPEYYLSFADEDKKIISYASSFGGGYQSTEEFKQKIYSYLKRFTGISVREDYAVDIVKNTFKLKAEKVLDPVFVCDPAEYDALIEKASVKINDDYFASFFLDPCKEKKEVVQFLNKELNLPYVNLIHAMDFEENARKLDLDNIKSDLDIEDFLCYYKNAKFIITDSFHGTCFAIIFRKPFISIANKQRGAGRFVSMLTELGLMDRLVNNYNEIYEKPELLTGIDYDKVYEVMEPLRKKSFAWLKNILLKPKKDLPGVDLPKTVSAVTDAAICTGCGACEAVCPVNAIKIKPNEDGFLAPIIDEKKCVYCGQCFNRCPSQNPQYKNAQSPKCYAMMANNETRKISSSGGMFTVSAEYILEHGGYVCGAAFDNNFHVKHIIIEDKKDLDKLRGSKYIQSEANEVYPDIKKLLEHGKTVLFTGMPCQVAGLYSYLNKEYENLYTIDLLCHGITSQKVFDKYREDVFGSKKLQRLEFKAKQPWGWHAGVNAYFDDGSVYREPCERDPYYVAYLNNISKNVTCGICKLNKLPRQGDLTIGDFWGIPHSDPSMYDGLGTSVVLANSPKGEGLFAMLKSGMKAVKEEPLNNAIAGNHCIEHPYPLHKNRAMFFQNLSDLPFEGLALGCNNNRLYEQIYMNLCQTVIAEEHAYYYLAKAAAEKSNGRKIVTWIRCPIFERILKEKFGLSVAFGVSMRKEAFVNNYILDFNELNGKSDKYYLAILQRNYDEPAFNQLTKFGYHDIKDYIFKVHKPIVLENYDLSKGNYYDDYGNSIEGFNAVIKRVVFNGCNNHIVLGKNLGTIKNVSFSFDSNGYVEIGENTVFRALFKIEIIGHNGASSVKIGKNCAFSDGLIRNYVSEKKSEILIDDFTTFENNSDFHANTGKKLIIGKDCMFSHNVSMWAGDGHAIYDVNTGKVINSEFSDAAPQKNKIVIGNHVWVGKDSLILNGSNVGSGSIIGAKSLVKGSFPNNCSVGGNPAKQIRCDIAWSRGMYDDNIAKCGAPEYAVPTSNSNAPVSGANVLVIGGTRFMGIELVKRLAELGNNVTIATRGLTKDSFGMRVNRLHMNILDSESVKRALNGKYFDVVFDDLAYIPSNVESVLSNVSCGKYVQLSSVMAYNNFSENLIESDFDPYTLPLEPLPLDEYEEDNGEKYSKGKALCEAYAYQKFPKTSVVTVRIPFVVPTDRLYYYCQGIVKQTPMNISDIFRKLTLVRINEVGTFLPWIAAQDFSGPINLSSEGFVTVKMILDHIEKRVGKSAVIEPQELHKEPFCETNSASFSMSMEKARQLGYHPSNLNDWLWKTIDEYIDRALREK